MARIRPRAYWDNLIIRTPSQVFSSSNDPSLPTENMLDQRRSKVWRSRVGWTTVLGTNDVIDVTESVSGAFQVILPPANASSGASVAGTLTNLLNAAATDNTYLVTYDTVTRKFTIARATGTAGFDLNWSTGPGALRTFGADLGFDTSSDDTGLLSYIGDNPVRKSAEFVIIDTQVAEAADAAFMVESNVDVSGNVRVQGENAGTFLSPIFEQVMVGGDPEDPGKLVALFTVPQSFRFWRFFFDDRDNPAGFSQFGFSSIGPATEFDRAFNLGLREQRDELTAMTLGDLGAVFTDIKPSRDTWNFVFKDTNDADEQRWREIANEKKPGQHWFFAQDPLNFPVRETVFGYIRGNLGFTRLRSNVDLAGPPVSDWTIRVPFARAIG